jgi:hypothetical protein
MAPARPGRVRKPQPTHPTEKQTNTSMMNTKTQFRLGLKLRGGLALATLALGLTAGAAQMQAQSQNPTQVPVPSGTGMANAPALGDYGLIGQNYYTLNFGYIHHVDGPPAVFHRYGFVANKPLAPGYDIGLAYDWLTGSAFGLHARQQELMVPLTAYLPTAWGRPFVEGSAGWVWQKAAGTSIDSFTYVLGAGFELQVRPSLVVTPLITYQEAPHLHDHVWNYGVKGTYRVTREWGVSLGAQIDEDHDLEYTAGVNFHF